MAISENELNYILNQKTQAQCMSVNKARSAVDKGAKGKEMGNHLNNIIFGLINQP